MQTIAVIGAGVMGHGIAEVCAIAGFEVVMVDVSEAALTTAMKKIKVGLQRFAEKGVVKDPEAILSRIKPTKKIEDAKIADFVIESVIEDINVKKAVFSKLDEITRKDVILSTNTSTLPITEIADATNRKEKVVGMHFFIPPPLAPLVEVVKGKETSEDTVITTFELAKKLGKDPIIVQRDVPGFIVNRILARFFESCCWIAASGKADIVEVDSAVRYKLRFPIGGFELADYVGIDVICLANKAMIERGFKLTPCPLFREKYEAGELGVKSGKGFYSYPSPGVSKRPEISEDAGRDVNELEILAPMVNEASWLLREGIVTKEELEKAIILGLGYKEGILSYADKYGLDRILETLRRLYKETGRGEYKPDPLLEQLVATGKLGIKTKEGFFSYRSSQQ